MPTDLLRYICGPTPYPAWCALVAAVLIAVVLGWYAGIYLWTLPPARLRRMRMISALHRRLLARRFTRTVTATTSSYHTGTITASAACAGYSRTLRSFLHAATGQRAQYLQTGDMARGPLAYAAPLIAALNDARFTPAGRIDVEGLDAAVREMIRSWN